MCRFTSMYLASKRSFIISVGSRSAVLYKELQAHSMHKSVSSPCTTCCLIHRRTCQNHTPTCVSSHTDSNLLDTIYQAGWRVGLNSILATLANSACLLGTTSLYNPVLPRYKVISQHRTPVLEQGSYQGIEPSRMSCPDLSKA